MFRDGLGIYQRVYRAQTMEWLSATLDAIISVTEIRAQTTWGPYALL